MSASPSSGRAARSGQPTRIAQAAWCGVVPLAAGAAMLAGVAPKAAGVGAAVCLAPALAGFALSSALRQEWAQVALVSLWTGLALAAAFVLGASSAAACWFLLPPVIAFTLGRRSLILESGVSSLLALGLATALEVSRLTPPTYAGAGNPVLPALAVAMAVVLVAAAAVAVRRHEARLRAELRRRSNAGGQIAEALPAAVLHLDADGRVTWAAGALADTLGRTREALSGLRMRDLAGDETAASGVQAALDEAMRFGQAQVELDMAPDKVLELRIAPVRGGAMAMCIDVTERALQARSAEESRAAAVAASEAKSRFLASMSHEIRTPLNAIIGFSDVMKQRMFGPLPAKYAEYADLIHESGRHLLDLVGDVLDMSKIEADRYELKLEEMDARDVAAAAAKLVRLRAEEAGVRLETDCGLGPLPVLADRKALRQILLNLLSNALKFTPKGGNVRLAVGSEGGDLVLCVSDTGAGMRPEEVQRVGQPYRQADSAGASPERGSGLGLSLVSALARLHGGALEIDSAPGEGTTALVRLPVLASTGAPVTRLDARARLQRAEAAGEQIRQDRAEAKTG